VEEPCGLGAVADAENLVGAAQVLLHGRLGQKEAFGYLNVGQAFTDEVQCLSLTVGEDVEVRRVFDNLAASERPVALISSLRSSPALNPRVPTCGVAGRRLESFTSVGSTRWIMISRILAL